jgi:DNA repair exonuclease SbcCD ATPase subunit
MPTDDKDGEFMRLLRLQLRNYCQHRERDIEFHEGLNALIGANGSGKTNSLNAMVWALTGLDRNHGVNDDNRCLLAGPEEATKVGLDFEHAGTFMRLERWLNPNRQVLTIGEESLTKAKDIADRLRQVLGVPPQLLWDYVFVNQWGMFDFLSHTESRRSDAFGKLFGLEKAEAIYQALTELRPAVPLIPEDGARLGERLEDLRRQQADLQRQAEAFAYLPQNWTEREDPNYKLIIRAEKEQELSNNCKRLDLQLAALAASEKQRSDFFWQRQKEFDLVQDVYLPNVDAISLYRQSLILYEAYQRTARQQEELQARMNQLDKTRPVEPFKPDYYIDVDDPIVQQMQELDLEKRRIERFLAAIAANDTPECPTCGTPTANLRAQATHYQYRLGEIAVDLEPFMEAWARSDTYRKQLARFHEQDRLWLHNRASLSARLAGCPQAPVLAYPPEVLKAKIREQDELAAGLEVLQREINQAAREMAEVQGQRTALKAERAHLPDLPENMVTCEEVTEARRVLQQRAQDYAARQELSQSISRITILEVECQTALARWQEQARQAQKLALTAQHLGLVRDVFHRDNLPKRLIEARLALLRTDVNDLLDRFEAPFRCLNVEGTHFLVRFHDGREHPAERLSGGLKVLFALAFRVAVNAQYAADLNLLCLDEPAAGLDKDNRECLGTAMERLRELSQQRGLQVILVTHEQGPQMYDRVIELGQDTIVGDDRRLVTALRFAEEIEDYE